MPQAPKERHTRVEHPMAPLQDCVGWTLPSSQGAALGYHIPAPSGLPRRELESEE
jgi:hypothetical protein